MRFVVDGHVHLYSQYDVDAWLQFLVANLKRAAGREEEGPTAMGAFLVDSNCSRAWGGLRQGGTAGTRHNFQVQADIGVMRLRLDDGAAVFLFPAWQVVTRERLELLAWFVDQALPDGLPGEEAVRQISSVGGWPVLTWAPGKWMFERGEVVWQLLKQFGPHQLLVGDSSLRPHFALMPRAMGWALRHGFRLVAGSDPLPVRGDERYAGSYGFRLNRGFDPERPVSSLKAALQGSERLFLAGRRRSGWDVVRSLGRHAWEKKRRAES